MSAPTVAVVIPSRDEAIAIADVVAGFRAALPAARFCVYDNVSEDDTARAALRAFLRTGQAPEPPALAVAAAGCFAALASVAAGLVLPTIAAGRTEARRLACLAAALTGHE